MDYEIARWIASISAVVAASVVAARLAPRITGWGFVIFTVSSLLWVTIGALEGEHALAFQNVVLTAINLYGVWRWLLRDA
ncbi:hypothetical protein [Oceanibacterium hippocampi]|uniref:Uncharacterized protein n=1 Tax=Oceanibacterium hippocampi TaxID=745714 RepID=A0A1Y5TW89_9PROT|nr:hypothetical protein [Oceanibacterium hippocampi]SLN73783.1 hypothetical protein OCH7691_03662 [Oceanibacterium hippocampi]